MGVHSYADDTQLYFHYNPEILEDNIQKLVRCIDNISHWMNVNRLKLNKEKTTFILLGAPHQLSQIDRRKIQLGETDIAIASEAMCLGVLLDSTLTFAPHVRRLAGRCFYHLRQLRTVDR